MRKLTGFVIGLLGAFLLSRITLAQGTVIPQHATPNWQATYWNNMSLSGPPALQRQEPALNYDWGSGSPAPSVNADGFSVLWQRYIDITPGTYRFTVTADDGIRVWVDGVLLIVL